MPVCLRWTVVLWRQAASHQENRQKWSSRSYCMSNICMTHQPAATCNCLPNAKGFIPITRQLLILPAVPVLFKCDWTFRCTSQLWLHFYVIMFNLYDKVLVKCLLGKGCVLQAMEISCKYAVSGYVGIFSRPLISHSRRSLNIKTPVLPVAEGGSLQMR